MKEGIQDWVEGKTELLYEFTGPRRSSGTEMGLQGSLH